MEIEPEIEDMYLGGGSRASMNNTSVHEESFIIPIEAKLRSLGVKLLYEVCRVQKMSVQELRECDLGAMWMRIDCVGGRGVRRFVCGPPV